MTLLQPLQQAFTLQCDYDASAQAVALAWSEVPTAVQYGIGEDRGNGWELLMLLDAPATTVTLPLADARTYTLSVWAWDEYGQVLAQSSACVVDAQPSPETAILTGTVRLAFPPFADDVDGARGAAVLRALVIVAVMVIVHSLYYLFAEPALRDLMVQVHDLVLLALFAGFQFVLLWMPERTDLQAAAFSLWLFLMLVSWAVRGLVHALTR